MRGGVCIEDIIIRVCIEVCIIIGCCVGCVVVVGVGRSGQPTCEFIFSAIHAKNFHAQKQMTQNHIYYKYRYARGFFILNVFSILTEIHIQK